MNYISKSELENILKESVNPYEINRIVSAYEMAENAHQNRTSKYGLNYFEHALRVCTIFVKELEIREPDLIIASLLNGIYDSDKSVTREIILYNFGPYVTYLIEELPRAEQELFELSHFEFKTGLRIPTDDYMILRLAEHLDNFRYLQYNPIFDFINYYIEIKQKFFDSGEISNNPAINYLIGELNKEKNKFFC